MFEEYKNLTVAQLIDILKELPQDATIGSAEIDSECDVWGNNELVIISDSKIDCHYSNKLDYYIL